MIFLNNLLWQSQPFWTQIWYLIQCAKTHVPTLYLKCLPLLSKSKFLIVFTGFYIATPAERGWRNERVGLLSLSLELTAEPVCLHFWYVFSQIIHFWLGILKYYFCTCLALLFVRESASDFTKIAKVLENALLFFFFN